MIQTMKTTAKLLSPSSGTNTAPSSVEPMKFCKVKASRQFQGAIQRKSAYLVFQVDSQGEMFVEINF